MKKIFGTVWVLLLGGTLCSTIQAETINDYKNKSLKVGNIVVDDAIKNRLIDEYNADPDEYKHFVSPQWGFESPEGYIRLTDYAKLAKEYSEIAKNYNLLMDCKRQASKLRADYLAKDWSKQKYADVENRIAKDVEALFKRAGIEMLEKGAYRLPDGAIVIEDDRHTMNPQSITYQKNAHIVAPTMLRDKSPNYSAFNEQTWPIYTNLKTIDIVDIIKTKSKRVQKKGRINVNMIEEPTVYSNKNCTYVVIPNAVAFYDHWFYNSSNSALVDRKTGEKYLVSYAEHMPLDTYYWVHDQSGKIVLRVFVFPPLPENVKKVDYVSGGIPQEIRLGNAGHTSHYKKLKVNRLL